MSVSQWNYFGNHSELGPLRLMMQVGYRKYEASAEADHQNGCRAILRRLAVPGVPSGSEEVWRSCRPQAIALYYLG